MTSVKATISDRLMMISVHPRHASDIVNGRKTVELRRTRPLIQPGQPVAIYATTPRAAVVATCRIEAVTVGSPEDIWAGFRTQACVDRASFDDYFAESIVAVALGLTDVSVLAHSVSLQHLRKRSRYQPPQTWHFLGRDRLRELLAEHPASSALHSLVMPLAV